MDTVVKSVKLDQPPAASGWKLALRQMGWLGIGVILLTLAFAPFGQFYLAWIGLVPWLLMLRSGLSLKMRFALSWLAGAIFFVANIWWLSPVNVLGMLALSAYSGFYWGLAALAICGPRVLEGPPILSVVSIASIWTALEFARGKLMTGFPWLFIGHTQSPNLPMCQIADALGLYGVSFWVVMVNAIVALGLIRRGVKPIVSAVVLVGAASVLSLVYGIWRMNQATTYPGPTVLVVQSNYPQSNSGDKGASDEELVRYHVKKTRAAIEKAGGVVNLVAWPETTLPPLNSVAQEGMRDSYRDFVRKAIAEISSLAKSEHTGILSGGRYWGKWAARQRDDGMYWLPDDSRNSTYLFQPDGTLGTEQGQRYDKIHLVPFGEYVPLRKWLAFTGKLTADIGDFTPGSQYSVGRLPDGRFGTFICFEAVFPDLVRRFTTNGAELLINISNDGWFGRSGAPAQHLMMARVRAVENRRWLLRDTNNGFTASIDPYGRIAAELPTDIRGELDAPYDFRSDTTIYTRFGDWWAWACIVASIVLLGLTMVRFTKENAASR